jgi:hypothetical protein
VPPKAIQCEKCAGTSTLNNRWQFLRTKCPADRPRFPHLWGDAAASE